MIANERLYTVEDFWDFINLPQNADRKFELVNGVMVEAMSPNLEHGEIALQIGAFMHTFVKPRGLGTVVVEVDHYIPPDRFNTRRPDVAFISSERLRNLVRNAAVPLMPDLAIEIKSPGNTHEELKQKAAYYLQNGSRIVWLVFPETQTVADYTTSDPGGKIFNLDSELDGGDGLPGFKLPVKYIFS
jgi:Uma2 family endonuclease